jgi:hypothetical protein
MYAVIELQPKFIFIKKIGRKFLVLEACCQEEKYFIKACRGAVPPPQKKSLENHRNSGKYNARKNQENSGRLIRK